MSKMTSSPETLEEATWYRGADVPMSVIRRFARQVAEQFRPDKIILFGSHAYGTPHADSDVDILVVMPTRNQLDQAARIELTCAPCFPLDIIVRSPEKVRRALAEGDQFLHEVLTRGKVLYEETDQGVGAQGGSRPPSRGRTRAKTGPLS